jgi:hypothetical protein
MTKDACKAQHDAQREEFYGAINGRVSQMLFNIACAAVVLIGGGMFYYVENDVGKIASIASQVVSEQRTAAVEAALVKERASVIATALKDASDRQRAFEDGVLRKQDELLRAVTRMELNAGAKEPPRAVLTPTP